jgi:uncharacterized membrane protein
MSELVTATLAKPRGMKTVLSRRSFFLVAALLVLTVGAALRIYHLGGRSLWFDEALTANTSRSTLTHMLDAIRSRGSAPVVHPFILYLVEKVGRSPVAVRTPSVLASLLAIFVMLAMIRTKVSRNAALFSASILAVSASQIRYAQEVREYSLAVLLAASLIYCLLRWEAAGSRSRHPALLYAILFFAPVVQYGLVFFSFGILCTIVLRLLLTRDTCFKLSHVVIASIFLAGGGLFSFLLTVRYQFHPGQGQWYLAASYFDPKAMSLVRFLATNSKGILSFFIPGQLVTLCLAIGAIIFCVEQVRTRKVDTIALLLFTSVSITMCASIVKLYPYGGIRQCLFLSPVVILFAGVVLADLVRRVKGSQQPIVAVAFMVLIFFSGDRGMLRLWPYGEYEDTQSILRELAKESAPNDEVWVNHDAVEAVDFYLQAKDPRFVYGNFHKDPNEYISEVFGEIDPRRDRVWLVFSHLQQPSDSYEKQLIVSTLESGWDVHPVITPTNAALYVADRRTSLQNAKQ